MLATVKPTTPVIAFTVIGGAEPHGLRPEPRYGPGRQIVGQQLVKGRDKEAQKRIESWEDHIARAARQAYSGSLLDGPLAVEFQFFRPRNKGDFGTGRNAGTLKPSAPRYPTTRPDVLKLARVVEDALSGVLYRDDSQIVEERLIKLYGEPARCEVTVWLLDVVADDSPSERIEGYPDLGIVGEAA